MSDTARYRMIETLRTARRRRGMSQETLATAIGYRNYRNVQRVEVGKNFPRIDMLARWAAVLGYEVVLRSLDE